MNMLLPLLLDSAAGLVVGVIGRNGVLGLAQQIVLLPAVERQVRTAGWFERVLVIPGSNLVFVSGLAPAWLKGGSTWFWPRCSCISPPSRRWSGLFLPRGCVFKAALDAARVVSRPTPELRAAFHDRAV